MIKCNLGGCKVARPLADMVQVEDHIDGAPFVGQVCTIEHGRQLQLLWATGPGPDELPAMVGNGVVMAA